MNFLISVFQNKKREIFITLFFCALLLLFAYLNRFHTKEQGSLWYHIRMMKFYLGDPSANYTLYPLWGYPLLLTLFKNINNIIWLQALLGGIVLSFLYLVVEKKISTAKYRKFLFVLMATAFPFMGIITVKWPAAFQLIFFVSSIISLFYAFKKNTILLYIISGIFLGLSSNFRSEYLYFSVFLFLYVLILWIFKIYLISKKQLIFIFIFILSSILTLIPLGLDRKSKTGKFSVFVGNGNYVNLFFTIGQLPGNSLKLKMEDSFVEEYLKKNIDPLKYTSFAPVHQQAVANDYCKKMFISYVHQHPGEYVRKILNNIKLVLISGFYIGEIENSFGKTAKISVVFIKEYFKSLTHQLNYSENMKLLNAEGFLKDSTKISKEDISVKVLIYGCFFLVVNLFFILIFNSFWIALIYNIFIRYRKKVTFSAWDVIASAPVIFGTLLQAIGLFQTRLSSFFYIFIVVFLCLFIQKKKMMHNARDFVDK